MVPNPAPWVRNDSAGAALSLQRQPRTDDTNPGLILRGGMSYLRNFVGRIGDGVAVKGFRAGVAGLMVGRFGCGSCAGRTFVAERREKFATCRNGALRFLP